MSSFKIVCLKDHASQRVRYAYDFANSAHEAVGQKRKYTQEPYIVHPNAVALRIMKWGGGEEQIIAALLHDVLEDTKVLPEEIEQHFGALVLSMVEGLTDRATAQDGNRAARQKINQERLAKQSAWVQSIKVCDIWDNIVSITQHDKKFAAVYLEEKRQQLEVLTKAHPELLSGCQKSLTSCERVLQEHALQNALEKLNKTAPKRNHGF